MTPSAPPSPQPKSQAARKWVIRAVLGAAIFALILSRQDTAREVGEALAGVSPFVLAASVAFYWAGQALCAWKWQLLLRARGVEVSLATCCRIYLAGMFGNLWLPTNIGGDALRATLMNRAAQVSLADAAASIIVERLTGFGALLFLAVLGLLLRGASGRGATIALLFFGVLGLLWVVVGRVTSSRQGKLAQKLNSLRGALDFYGKRPFRSVLWVSLALSLFFQASQVLLNIGLARAAQLELPLATFWWLAPLLSLSGLIPAGIGGFGVREGAALALLRGDFPHLAAGQIVAWSLLWQATVWLASLPGALFLKPEPVKERVQT
jgi:uncharacterized membrane protein YbhN (UPF0104 family)